MGHGARGGADLRGCTAARRAFTPPDSGRAGPGLGAAASPDDLYARLAYSS